jgi:hypothetical protein
MFRLLGATPVDVLDDLFPGSGAVSRAWSLYVSSSPARSGLPSRLEDAQHTLTEMVGRPAEISA